MAGIHDNRSSIIPLHRDADFSAVMEKEWSDIRIYLGSYWPYSTSSYESRLIKSFKESMPTADFQPQISCLVNFYAAEIMHRIPATGFNNVVRALSSSETIPDKTRPQGLLVRRLCEITGAVDSTDIFFRSQPRASMRMVSNLSGAIALNQRLRYASQDLICRPARLGERVLIVDDIANTGATMRLLAWALKCYFGVREVWSVNLAITRFGGGKDGIGHLELDISGLTAKTGFAPVMVDEKGLFHVNESCIAVSGKTVVAPMFFAQKRYKRCPHCPSYR